MPPTFVADLHIHSRFSRATSRELDLEHLWVWAQRKGVGVVGTGDFTHPGWFAELESKLQPEGDGLFTLREPGAELAEQVPASCRAPVRFMLTVEISSIYKRDGRTRKVHNLICLPDLQAAAALNRALGRIGNLGSDGRPILGLDSEDLLELVLEADPERGVLIPAHIWTPWFSVLGSKSGFDSIEACYGKLSDHIFAVETGLSSDPPMNWRLSALDRYTLVSNSDAHSPGKLAREANLFGCEPSYDGIFAALRRPEEGFLGTVEFFPEEGKYHLDGHRKCGCRMSPAETRERDGLCPGCGKPVTLGVLYRVEQLADRPEGERPDGAAPFVSLVGFSEVVGEALGVGAGSKKVARVVRRCTEELGCELDLLRRAPLEDLARRAGPVVAEAVRRMRAGELQIEGGYDGEFGRVHLLRPDERGGLAGQGALFAVPEEIDEEVVEPPPKKQRPQRGRRAAEAVDCGPLFSGVPEELPSPDGLSAEQRRAVEQRGAPLIIWAGPGTGKTRTLTRRIAHRVEQGADPGHVLAVTFTVRAAGELRERLGALLGPRAERIRVSTFHALALGILNDQRRAAGLGPLEVVGEEQRLELVQQLVPKQSGRSLSRACRALVDGLQGLADEDELLTRYRALLVERGAVDLEVLVAEAVQLLEAEPELLARWRQRCQMICVDEYQDVNRAQVELVRLLAPPGGEPDLCVIGDADQAIYGFRGADPAHFLRFARDYPGAAVHSLERSYRSASGLLEAAQQVIRHNPERPEARLWSSAPGAGRVMVHRAPSAAAEAEHVVHSIERLLGGTTLFSLDSGRTEGAEEQLAALSELSFADIAVLYRTTAQAEALEQALDRSGIPCRSAPRSGSPLEPLWDLVSGALEDRLEGEQARLAAELEQRPAREGLELLVRGCLDEDARPAALELVRALAAQLYDLPPGLAGWGPVALSLGRTAFLEADRIAGRAEAVSLLTLHASKGLEFQVVFIVGCEEGLLPHLLPGEEQTAERVAEERRLFYVGMTRAERLLLLSHATKRQLHGRLRQRQPSRFIAEIAPSLRLHSERQARRRAAPQLDLF